MKRPGFLFVQRSWLRFDSVQRLPLRFASVLALAAAMFFSAWGWPAFTFAQTQAVPTETPAFVPGQLIISFHDHVTPEEVEAFYAEYGMVEMDDLDPNPNKENGEIRLAFVPVEIDAMVAEDLSRDPRVAYAEPNFVVQLQQTTPNDPHFSRQWGHHNTGQTGGTAGADVSAPAGWGVSTGSSDVVLAVIDTGIDYNHEDLAANVWVNPLECPEGYGNCVPNGQDDSGSGYADDFYGINTINDTGDPMDDFGHGTHVAGVMAANTNNNLGVAGLNWNARVVACKFLGASGGGTIAGAVKCFNYIRHLKNQQDVNVVVTNNSWGGGGHSQALEDAMAGADQPLHVAAAGNSNTNAPHYPAAFDLPNMIAVAATDHNDQYSNFSNYGDWVHLAAPGSNVFSTVPTGQCPMCDSSGYALSSGTSMATPYVAGAVGLIASQYPELTHAQIIQRILNGVDSLPDSNKHTQTNGRLNLFNSLEDDDVPPAAIADLTPTLLMLTGVELRWTASGDDGMEGRASAYDLRYSQTPITEESWNQATRVPDMPAPLDSGETETFVVGGLEPDTVYYFAIRAMDNVGNESPISNVVMAKTIQGTVVFEDDVESGPGEWTAAGTHDLWGISQRRANSPTHSWYYGNENTGSYETGTEPNSGTLTSGPIDLVTNDNVALIFYEWSEIEDSPTYDRTRVQVSINGSAWETVFESIGTDNQWRRRLVDITPQVGDSNVVYVRFWFDTVDNRFNDFEGWYVDDIRVMVGTPTVPGEVTESPNLLMYEGNIGLSDPQPTLGDEITVHAIVINNGVMEANNVQVQFVDASLEPPTPIGDLQVIPNLPAGGSAAVQMVYDTAIHGGGEAGERVIQVVVDPYDMIAESNEADNTASREFTVDAPPMPNLAVRSANIGFNPVHPMPGDQVVVQAVIQNDGEVPVDDVTVQFMDVTDSDATVLIGESQTINSIGPGETAVVQVTYDTTGKQGTRRIQVIVDPENRIEESDRADNEATATLTMVTDPLPNLVMSTLNVGFDPASPVSGQEVTILATVLNEGEVEANNVVVQFTDTTGGGSRLIGEAQTIENIPPGGSGLAQLVYNTTGLAGDRRIQIRVDPQNLIEESRETDNEATVTLRIEPPPLPNLVMQSGNINIYPAQPVQGEPVTVRAVILNTGGADAENVTVQFQDATGGSPVPIGEPHTIPMVRAGAAATVETEYETEGLLGERRIQVIVDPSHYIVESNEQDNQATASLTVLAPPKPNLTMIASNILFEPLQPVQGDEVTITAVVLNTGDADASNVLVQFVDVTHSGFEPIGVEQTIDLVPKGGSATAQITYDTSQRAGNRRIQILVDSNNLIEETDDSDNEAVTTLTVEALPLANLVVRAEGIGLYPSRPRLDDEVTVTVTVHNHGDVPADNVEVQLLDVSQGELQPVGEIQTVDHIAPGGAALVEMSYTITGGPGERRLRVVVDPSNFIAETDVTDNRATVAFEVAPGHAPNLAISAANIGFEPRAPVDGDVVTIRATILNNGSDDAHDVLVQFVDATGGAADPIGEKLTIALIPAGSRAVAEMEYDTTGKAGERRITVVVDPHRTVTELSETDNEVTVPLVVTATPRPNLAIRDANIGFHPARPQPGEEVLVNAVIQNIGRADADRVEVQFMDVTGNGAVPIGVTQVISSIPAGGSSVVGIAYSTNGRFGDRTIQVVVDPNNRILETDTSNNRATAILTVRAVALPDLVIRTSGIGFDPPVADVDDTVEVYATIRNEGAAPASEIPVQFMDVTGGGATPIGDVQIIPAIAPGGSAVAHVTYNLLGVSGDRRIQVTVDPNRTLIEGSTTNNQATVTLNRVTSPQADLAVLSHNISFSNGQPVEGESTQVYAVILNVGEAEASNVIVNFADVTNSGRTQIGSQQVIPSLPPGSSATVSVAYNTTGRVGERSIEVVADPNNLIPESRTTNNSARTTLTVVSRALPDLVMHGANINFSPLQPIDGEATAIRALVLNHGLIEARDVIVQFTDVTGTPQAIGAPQSILRILPGSGATAQVMLDTDELEGQRTIQVTVDPNNLIPESDLTNNQATRSLVVGAPPLPDLVAMTSNITFDPESPRDGDLLTIHAGVLNSGTDTAHDVVVRIEDVTGGGAELIDRQRLIDVIRPGETATTQVTYDLTGKQGERSIRMVIDPNNDIAESDDSNNAATVSLVVEPPPAANLVMRSNNISFSPPSPVSGEQVTIMATVLNDGQVGANSVEVRFVDATNGGSTQIGDVQVIGSIPVGGSGQAQVTYDTTGRVGERTIRVIVDPNNHIPETDESDNEAEATLTIREEVGVPEEPPDEPPSDLPNLGVTPDSITFDPANPEPGEPVTISVTVSNSGGVEANDVVVRISDATGDEPEQIGDDQVIESIAAGESGAVSVEFSTPAEEGDRLIHVIVDPDNQIEEEDESNNEATRTLPVGGDPGDEDEPENGDDPGDDPDDGDAPVEDDPGDDEPVEDEPGDDEPIEDEPENGEGDDPDEGNGEEENGDENDNGNDNGNDDDNGDGNGDEEENNTGADSGSEGASLIVRADDIRIQPVALDTGDVLQVAVILRNVGERPAQDVDVYFREVVNGEVRPLGEPYHVDMIPAGGNREIEIEYDPEGRPAPFSLQVAISPEHFERTVDKLDLASGVAISVVPTTGR